MNINFKTNKLEKTINTKRLLCKEYGDIMARVIMRRMDVLRAANNLSEVSHFPPERRHPLLGDRLGEFAVDLKHPFRLIFKPNHTPVPLQEDGGIALDSVTSITILEIGDYH